MLRLEREDIVMLVEQEFERTICHHCTFKMIKLWHSGCELIQITIISYQSSSQHLKRPWNPISHAFISIYFLPLPFEYMAFRLLYHIYPPPSNQCPR
jgi:hypothetical protein